jgi:hypothetical protein
MRHIVIIVEGGSGGMAMSSIENGTGNPVSMGSLTKEEIDAEISKGIKSIEEGRVYSADTVEAETLAKQCLANHISGCHGRTIDA